MSTSKDTAQVANPIHFLRKISLFKSLKDDELFDMVRTCKRSVLPEQTVICREGEYGSSMYLIEDGMVQVTKHLISGTTVTLATLTSGAVIGEMALIDPSPRSATIKTLSPAVIYEVDKMEFDYLKTTGLTAPYKVLKEISKILAQRLRDTEKRLDALIGDAESIFQGEVGGVDNEAAEKKVRQFRQLLGKGKS